MEVNKSEQSIMEESCQKISFERKLKLMSAIRKNKSPLYLDQSKAETTHQTPTGVDYRKQTSMPTEKGFQFPP